jgi:hypothetical protein
MTLLITQAGGAATMRRQDIGTTLLSALLGLVVISGLVGALLLARPALDVEHQPSPEAPEAAETP